MATRRQQMAQFIGLEFAGQQRCQAVEQQIEGRWHLIVVLPAGTVYSQQARLRRLPNTDGGSSIHFKAATTRQGESITPGASGADGSQLTPAFP
ncbi:hypothetical protein Pstu01_37150 [Stutzerimonas stutzeri]|nr:hypothetical protein Pstu01_37150 [Stutzerimonas stutzeri]